jgi:hypothetical protein
VLRRTFFPFVRVTAPYLGFVKTFVPRLYDIWSISFRIQSHDVGPIDGKEQVILETELRRTTVLMVVFMAFLATSVVVVRHFKLNKIHPNKLPLSTNHRKFVLVLDFSSCMMYFLW